MNRRLLVLVFMLFSVGMLSLPKEAAAVSDFCADCAQQCWNEANTGENNAAYWRCIDDGYSQASCDNIAVRYYNDCVSIFCNYGGSCSLPQKTPRLCKVGPCY